MSSNPYAASIKMTEAAINPLATAQQPDLRRWFATSSCYAIGCVAGLHGIMVYQQGLNYVWVLLNEPLSILLASIGFAAVAVLSSTILGWLWSAFLLGYNQFLAIRFLAGFMFAIGMFLSIFPVQRYLMDDMNWITDLLAGTRLNASTSVIAFIFALILSQAVESVMSRTIGPTMLTRRIRLSPRPGG